ncbi:Lrp/AsnC family transcriptional regulator [Candidatus Woesearchaeota archaeon]|nr:Lrp/AsnC family transcriptional regulator [Candidatus Woesearchaeota archaeon]
MKINHNNRLILKHLRVDARKNFSVISRETGIPVTTVFDNYQKLAKSKIITRHAALVDFRKLGFFYRSFVFVKAKDKSPLLGFLNDHPGVNSIFKISNYDFLLDVVFPTIKEFYIFMDDLRDFDVQKLESHDIIEHVKQEEFFCN